MSSAGRPERVVEGPKRVSETITQLRSGEDTIDTSTEKDDTGKQDLGLYLSHLY